MSAALSVHFAYALDTADHAVLTAALHPTIAITHGELPHPPTYEVLVAGRPTRAQLDASPNLKKMLIPFAGLPTITRETMAEYPAVAVHNLHHNAPIVAEMTLAMLLAAARFIVPIDQTFRQHDWSPRYSDDRPAVMLAGRTALILGYGAIGQRVAALCTALGMHVMATKRRLDDKSPDFVHPASALHDLLPQADVLIIAMPLTPATEGLIGERELAMLRPKPILVNIGRAAIVDERAFYEALKDGRLHAAAADVWYQYPQDVESRRHTPPSQFPFHELPNMVMSPHRSGHVDSTETLRMQGLAASLNAYAATGEMPYPVDLDVGY